MDDAFTPRRTKIVATLGPSSGEPKTLRAMIRAGMDVARLNFSHGSHEEHKERAQMIRDAEMEAGRPIAILQDLQGPKIRLGKLQGEVELVEGSDVLLSSDGDFLGTQERLPTTYARLSADVEVGERLLLADGALVLRAKEVRGMDVLCEIEVGGVVTSNKGLNMPESDLSVPSLVEKDMRDLEVGLSIGVDFVALSFVRTPHDVLALREQMDRLGKRAPIIAKIEKPQAVEYLSGIIDVSDGIMVARGDLGVELPAERVPGVQRRAIRLARERGKVAIVATQMLVSMTKQFRPTHAEVSDVANAVFDGADAVMLSEETASGSHPVEAVEMMAAINRASDNGSISPDPCVFVEELRNSDAGAIARAAVVMAEDLHAVGVVSFTDEGLGPRLISSFRSRARLFGVASSVEATRRMALYWGVRPLKIEEPRTLEELTSAVERAAMEKEILPRGSSIVLTTKTPFEREQRTNVLKLHKL